MGRTLAARGGASLLVMTLVMAGCRAVSERRTPTPSIDGAWELHLDDPRSGPLPSVLRVRLFQSIGQRTFTGAVMFPPVPCFVSGIVTGMDVALDVGPVEATPSAYYYAFALALEPSETRATGKVTIHDFDHRWESQAEMIQAATPSIATPSLASPSIPSTATP